MVIKISTNIKISSIYNKDIIYAKEKLPSWCLTFSQVFFPLYKQICVIGSFEKILRKQIYLSNKEKKKREREQEKSKTTKVKG